VDKNTNDEKFYMDKLAKVWSSIEKSHVGQDIVNENRRK